MRGFTLVEVLVAILILALVVGAVFGGYALSQRAYRSGEISAELTQNGRVVLERMTREIRQAREIVTELPDNRDEGVNSIEFEDGNLEELYHYIRYFQEGNEVKREVRRYYFPDNPGVYVPWNAILISEGGGPEEGQAPDPFIAEEPQVIGEFVNDFKIWSPEIRMIGVSVNLEKNDKQVNFETSVLGRNL